MKVAIAVARFNEYVTSQMLERCVARLAEQGIGPDETLIAWAPGSFDLPLAAMKMASRDDVDAVICLGAVIRGETAHFDHVAYGASMGITRVALDSGKPVIFGVLTTDNAEQAVARVGQGCRLRRRSGRNGWACQVFGIVALRPSRLLANIRRPESDLWWAATAGRR